MDRKDMASPRLNHLVDYPLVNSDHCGHLANGMLPCGTPEYPPRRPMGGPLYESSPPPFLPWFGGLEHAQCTGNEGIVIGNFVEGSV